MIEDDHSIDNSRNAHIDTSQFESALLKRLSCSNLGVDESLEYIYNFTFSTTNITPKEPPDNQLICRYLSPSKFLQFVHTRHINFPMATQFSDCWECRVPDDYETAVLCVTQRSRHVGERLDQPSQTKGSRLERILLDPTGSSL
jgi:hypothetical protein